MIAKKLLDLNQDSKTPWTIQVGRLHKDFSFASFTIAFEFMRQVADIVETMNHHPEWSNVYRKVSIDLMTHEVSGLSDLDFELAQKIEKQSLLI